MEMVPVNTTTSRENKVEPLGIIKNILSRSKLVERIKRQRHPFRNREEVKITY